MKTMNKKIIMMLSCLCFGTAAFAASALPDNFDPEKFEEQFRVQAQASARTVYLEKSPLWFAQLQQKIETRFLGQMPSNNDAMTTLMNQKKVSAGFHTDAKRFCDEYEENGKLHTQCLIKSEELINQYKALQKIIKSNKNFIDFQLDISPALLEASLSEKVNTYPSFKQATAKTLIDVLNSILSTTETTPQGNIVVPSFYAVDSRQSSPYIVFDAADTGTKEYSGVSFKYPYSFIISFDLDKLLIRVFTKQP